MKRILLLAAAAALSVPAVAQAGDTLNVVSWGGAYSDSQKKAFVDPYVKEGHTITMEDYNGEIAKIRAMVESKAVTWDVIDIDTQTALAACAEGILEKIDWAKLGLDRSKFIGGDLQDCAVPNIVYATIYAYDTTKFPNGGPSTTADLFDLAKFPGKRALQKSPFVNLEWALIADGVPQADLYKVLNTPEGVDRAFKKLDTIKSEVVWWEAGAQPPQLLADGQVALASAWNGRIQTAIDVDKKPFKIVWDNQGFDWDWWAIVKGGPRVEEGYRFISFASRPDRMADQTNYIAYGPANQDAIPNVNPAVLPNLPTAPANMGTALIVDVQFWADNGDALRERFNAWLAK